MTTSDRVWAGGLRGRLTWSRRTDEPALEQRPLSITDPVFLGVDEDGARVVIELAYRNLLVGGEPGGGKSVLLSNVIAHAALSTDAQLWLLDGK